MDYVLRAQGTMEYLVIIAIVIVISLVVVGMSGALVNDSGGQVVSNTTDLSSKTGSSSGGVAIVESATDSSGNGLIKLSNFTGEGFSLTKVRVVTPSGALVDNNFSSVYVGSSGSLAFSLKDLGSACECVAGETEKICTFVVEYTSSSGLAKSQRVTTNVACVSAISSSGTVINPIDSANPTVSITVPESGSTISDSGEVDFEYTATDNNTVKECSLLIDDVLEDTDDGSPFDSFTYEFSLNGDYDYEIECEDYSNNTGSDTGTLTIDYFDETDPSVTLAGPADENLTYNSLVDFNFYVSDNNALSECVLVIDDADVNTIISVTNGTYHQMSYTFSSYADYEWDIRCTDSSSNSATSGAPRTVTYSRVLTFAPQWARTPFTESTGGSMGRAVAMDSSKNVYIAGDTGTDINFGAVLLDKVTSSTDFFVAKYDLNGTAQWVKSTVAPTTGTKYAYAVAADSSLNVYTAGYYNSADLNFGGSVKITRLGVTNDFFVVKYNSSGVVQWAKGAAGDTNNSYSRAYGVTADSSENVYVVGYFKGADLNFGTGVKLTSTSPTYNDFFVVKYDSSGTPVWAKSVAAVPSSLRDETAYGVVVDSSQNVYVAGEYSSSDLNFGGNVKLINSSTNTSDFFVVKYNSSGVAQWAKSANGGSSKTETSRSVGVDGSGNVYIEGYFDSATLDFGGGITLDRINSSSDFFIAKYDSSGNPVWVKGPAASRSSSYGKGISVDTSGNVYLTGYFNSTSDINFGGNWLLTNTGGVSGGNDFFVAKYNTNGDISWAYGTVSATQLGEFGVDDSALGIAANSSGDVVVQGYYDTTDMNFGGEVMITKASGEWQWEFFVVKYGFE